jgi:hypothetical protein
MAPVSEGYGQNRTLGKGGRSKVMSYVIEHHTGLDSLAAAGDPDAVRTIPFRWHWPEGAMGNLEYFDVSIAPIFDGEHVSINPLVEEQRSWSYVLEGTPPKVVYILNLRMRNPNPFPVKFTTNYLKMKG